MITVELEVFNRESLGKQANKKYRKDGFIPAVIYGKNKDNLNILVDPIKLKKLLKNEAGENTIIEMKLDNKLAVRKRTDDKTITDSTKNPKTFFLLKWYCFIPESFSDTSM